MPQENLRVTLATMKKDSEVAMNGYTIKRKGTNWIVKKGDFYNRSFTEQQLNKLVEKLTSETITEVAGKVRKRDTRKANKLNKKLEVKQVREKKSSERLAIREERAYARANRPFKRNKFLLEGLDLIVQGLAYLTWFAYFFTTIIQDHLGEGSIFAVIGILVLSLGVHITYVRQLGKRHRILNSVAGLTNMILAIAALSLYYGPLSHTVLEIEQVLPSLELAFNQVETISLVAFLFVKWVLTLIVNKK